MRLSSLSAVSSTRGLSAASPASAPAAAAGNGRQMQWKQGRWHVSQRKEGAKEGGGQRRVSPSARQQALPMCMQLPAPPTCWLHQGMAALPAAAGGRSWRLCLLPAAAAAAVVVGEVKLTHACTAGIAGRAGQAQQAEHEECKLPSSSN